MLIAERQQLEMKADLTKENYSHHSIQISDIQFGYHAPEECGGIHNSYKEPTFDKSVAGNKKGNKQQNGSKSGSSNTSYSNPYVQQYNA